MKKQKEPFWIVGIGASAGGLEALSTLFKSLPLKPPAAFVVAQHLAPLAKSMMVELIARQTKLPVVSVIDKQKMKPGHIYIVPPNYDVSFVGTALHLTKAGAETRPKPSVDYFFESLATTYQRMAVGIILSGTGTDGARGIRAIKENGGITFAQVHDNAKYDGMPKAAVDTGMVDYVFSTEELGQHLISILMNEDVDQKYPAQEDSVFTRVVSYLKKEIGTDFTQYKSSTIQRRIEKRMGTLGLPDVANYLSYMQENPAELNILAQEMLVSVTSFFRDTSAFEFIKSYLEDLIVKKPQNEELRIWSAGCATGEEPYSIAFIIAEILQKYQKKLPVKIFATDLDLEALSQARSGVYKLKDISELPDDLINKFFDKKDHVVEVRKSIRDMVVFARQDLVQNPPFVKLDLVLCRNVLIYFEATLQKKIFDIFHYALKPNGTLFLGKSETAIATLFECVEKKHKVYKRLNVVSGSAHTPFKYTLYPQNKLQKSQPNAISSLAKGATLQLLKLHNISALVVDEESTIIHILGDVSEFINVPGGQADFRVSNLLPKGPSIEFQVLLRKAAKDNKSIKSRSYKLDNMPNHKFSFSISPLEGEEETIKHLFLVSFEMKRQHVLEDPESLNSNEVPRKVIELELELTATKQNLQTVIEELEIANEELQSLNEELSSTNEELQASNEELETTNEELQSTNEELMTLNEEVNVKSSELRLANVSLENILHSIASPLLVIDREGKLIRYNEHAKDIFHLTFADIGHKITRASCYCEINNFEDAIVQAIDSGKVQELKCVTSTRSFQVRIHANRDDVGGIIGALIIFFDNTEFLQAQEKLLQSDKRVRAIIDGTPALISLKDPQGRYLSANKAFLKQFDLKEEDVVGKSDRDIFSDEVSSLLRDHDLEVLFKKEQTEYEERITFNDTEQVFYSSRFPLFGNNDSNPYAIGTVALNITGQMKLQEELKINESRYRAIIEEQAVFVCRHQEDGHFTFTNKAFVNYFGESVSFLAIVAAADRSRVSQELDKLSIVNPIIQYEHRVISPTTASSRWVRWIHRALYNEDGALVEYQAVGFDSTEIHNRTASLLEKEALFSSVLEYTSDSLSVFKTDSDNFILESFNQNSAKYGGLTQNRFLGMSIRDLLDEESAECILSSYQKCATTKKIVYFDEELPAPAGARYLSNTLVPILDNDQNVIRIVAISRDITKLKRTEIALRNEKFNADEANRAKSDFLASMSHELRTPLNVIMGMSQLLSRSQLKPESLKLVESILRSSKVLLSLIEDVLDLSKIEAGKINFELKPFSLNLLLQDVFQSFEVSAQQKKIDLVLKKSFTDDIILLGDQVRLKQILINLLGNAIKFTEQGSVTLSIQVSEDARTLMSTVFFEIIDTGIGIEKSDFDKIFKRFSQADSGSSRKFGGTGLGLAISKQLVELMNGKIGFDSEKNQGSVFWFRIPFHQANHLDQEMTTGQERHNFREVVLLAVDDNLDSLKLLQLMLEGLGATVHCATSGFAALEIVERESPDLILMDMQMPRMDGMETTRRIRQLDSMKKALPIVALTANAMPGDKEKCLQSGMNDYLTKPVDINELQLKLLKWVKK